MWEILLRNGFHGLPGEKKLPNNKKDTPPLLLKSCIVHHLK